MRILVYLWYLSVQMQFRLHLHMHGRPLLKNFDLSSAPGRVRTDTGVLLGDRPLLWATGAANNNLASLSFRQSRSARATGRHIQGGTGEFAFTGDAAPAVPPRRAGCPGLRTRCGPAHLEVTTLHLGSRHWRHISPCRAIQAANSSLRGGFAFL